MTPAQRIRAAELLEDDAEMLWEGYVEDGEWPEDLSLYAAQGKRDHDELRTLAAALRAWHD